MPSSSPVRRTRGTCGHWSRRLSAGSRRRTRQSPVRIEGLQDATWVLMDYGDFIAHVFLHETREYYDLEHLWSGAPRVPWRGDVQNAG
jgi:ribosomal silencing factor RsfS